MGTIHQLIEYGICIWNVRYLQDVRRLESVQRKRSREVHGMAGYDYAARLRSNGLFSVRGRLLRLNLCTLWKCFHTDVDVRLIGVRIG